MSDPCFERRAVIAGLGAAAAGLCLPARAAVRQSPLQVDEIAPGAWTIRGAGGNVFAVRTKGGLVIVDTGNAASASQLQRVLRERFGGAPVRWAFNTHWHPDHTGGNERIRGGSTEIVSHENTRLWMGTSIDSRWDGAHYDARPRAAWPTRTFYADEQFDAGDELIDSGYLLQAHTDGDIYVRFAHANVLVTGDVFTVGSYPVTDPATLGWIGGLTAATERLVKLCDATTRIVPGSGPVQDKAALEAQLAMLTAVRDRLYALLREGRSVEEMLEARPTREFDAAWGDPTAFIRSSFAGMTAHVRQIPGIV